MDRTLLARALPQMLAAKAWETVLLEAAKGCQLDVVPHPVQLEPAYYPLGEAVEPATRASWDAYVPDTSPREDEWVRLQLWISPDQKCDWNRSEMFLKNLSSVQHRVALEIMGNRKQILQQLLCHQDDLPIVMTAFRGQFEHCQISPVGADSLLGRILPSQWAGATFYDFAPPPPYSRLLTRPEELRRSPYTSLLAALAEFHPPLIGLYQVVFQPVDPTHNWHHNVQFLKDIEFRAKLLQGVKGIERYTQQAPSGDLRQMAMDVECKSHNDKPFFSTALRVAVLGAGESASSLLRALSVGVSAIQHGGRPLNYLTAENCQQVLNAEALRAMLSMGLTYRPGFLVNSEELASLAHVPSPRITEPFREIMGTLETLPADGSLSHGTPIGICAYADTQQAVCIPPGARKKHAHVIGNTGTGKSTMLESMILHEIRQGQGVAVLDPHGTLIRRLLKLIPEECVDRVIYFDPGDRDWVPIWNPFSCGAMMNRSRIADDLVRAFKSMYTGWGNRMEHFLRHAFLGVLHLPNASLLEVSNLLRKKSVESRRLRDQLLKVVDNEVVGLFWRDDFDNYGQPDLSPPQHMLSKLLTSETVGCMLSQGESLFSFRDVMDSGKVLLVNLANVGSEVLEILGCFVLSLLHLTAMGRGSSNQDTYQPFHIYCDEAHRFLTDAMEDLIAETRKFNVSLTLAHQFMSQFGTRKTDALSSVGSTVIFRVDEKDARHLKKDLQGRVTLDDLTTLEVGQAVVRVDNHIVRVRTTPPLDIPSVNFREQIIARSRQLYCRPSEIIRKAIRERFSGGVCAQVVSATVDDSASTGQAATIVPGDSPGGHSPEAFSYETF